MSKTKKTSIEAAIAQVTEDDLKILQIIKKHRQTICDASTSSYGVDNWYELMYDADDYFADNSNEEVFMKADIHNRLKFFFDQLYDKTKLLKGLSPNAAFVEILIELSSQ